MRDARFTATDSRVAELEAAVRTLQDHTPLAWMHDGIRYCAMHDDVPWPCSDWKRASATSTP